MGDTPLCKGDRCGRDQEPRCEHFIHGGFMIDFQAADRGGQ